jgi:hypothetical protein
MNMRTRTIAVVDRNSVVSGPSIPQFVTLPAAPWETADGDKDFTGAGQKVVIYGKTFANVKQAARELHVDLTYLRRAIMFDRMDQYLQYQLSREKSGARLYNIFTELHEKSLERKTCPPCNHNCNEGRDCPERNK